MNSEAYNHHLRSCWKLVTDSSLNGNDTFELVSPILVGEDGLEELEKVCWVLDACNVKINGSCGMHVLPEYRVMRLISVSKKTTASITGHLTVII